MIRHATAAAGVSQQSRHERHATVTATTATITSTIRAAESRRRQARGHARATVARRRGSSASLSRAPSCWRGVSTRPRPPKPSQSQAPPAARARTYKDKGVVQRGERSERTNERANKNDAAADAADGETRDNKQASTHTQQESNSNTGSKRGEERAHWSVGERSAASAKPAQRPKGFAGPPRPLSPGHVPRTTFSLLALLHERTSKCTQQRKPPNTKANLATDTRECVGVWYAPSGWMGWALGGLDVQQQASGATIK